MTASALRTAPGESKRRTQAERSEAMRQRLIDATVLSLEREGYAGTTVSTIIATAGVSRGAPLHHFPTKAALIEATAEHLIRRIYVLLGQALGELQDSDDRLTDMVMTSWREIFNSTESSALRELMLASRRDSELADVMRQLWTSGYQLLDSASWHFFQSSDDAVNPTQLFVLTHWLMSGLALERHLTGGDHVSEHYLQLWCRVLRDHLKARPGVNTPPPKPEVWDRLLTGRG